MKPTGRQGFKLNDYQRLMLKISHLTAYNAVHAVRLASKQRDIVSMRMELEFAINDSLQSLGMGIPIFCPDYRFVHFTSDVPYLVLSLIESKLEEHVNKEMNSPFREEELPFRFYLIKAENTHYLSITYNHWIADAYGISRLIESIFGDFKQELTLYPPDMATCFPKIYGVLAPIYRLVAIFSSFFRFSRVYRTPIKDIELTESANTSYIFEPAVLFGLREYCKGENISLNDLFVSILAQIFSEQSQKERSSCQQKYFKPKRDKIIIAIIANIRQQSCLCLEHVFSVFLGFFYLSFKTPESLSLKTLGQSVNSQTQDFKKKSAALKQSLLFKVQNWFWDRKKSKSPKYRLFSKNTPITLGVSNMDMRHISPILNQSFEQYIRFSPTAIVCPIVFNFTTFNQYLSLGINFRKACFRDETVDRIQSDFVMAISQLIAQQHDKHASKIFDLNFREIKKIEDLA